MSSSFKIKPLVIAIGAMVGVLSSYQSSAASIDVSTSSGGLTNSTTLDLLDITNTGIVTGTDFGIVNTSTIGTLSNAGSVTANDAIYNNNGSIGTLTNSGLISALDGTGIWTDAGDIDFLTNTGTITGHKGVYFENESYLDTFINQGYLTGTEDAAFLANNSDLCVFQNSGTIQGQQGVVLENTSMLEMFTNSGVITTNSENGAAILLDNSAVYNLSNTGTISGDGGIIVENGGGLEILNNDGRIDAGLAIGAFSDNNLSISSIGTIINTGVIDANEAVVIQGNATLGTLNNSGTIDAGLGIGAFGNQESVVSTIGTIINNGLIDADDGIIVAGGSTIGSISNAGTISALTGIGVYQGGTLGTLMNSGLISGESAALAVESASMGTIYNTGTIKGDIHSTSGLSFYGRKGEGYGMITGYGDNTIGTISIAGGDLLFVSGNMLLNSNVTLGEGDFVNQAADILVNNVLSIDGDYHQGSESSQMFGVSNYYAATGDIYTYNGYGRLVVSGSANISSGAGIGLISNGQYTFAQGQRYVVIRANTDGTNYNAGSLDYWADNYVGLLTGNVVTNGSYSDLVVVLGDCNGNYRPVGYASTSNAVSSLNGLFNYAGTDATMLNLFNASAALGSTAAANRAGDQLSPAAIASATAQASVMPGMSVLNVLAQRGEAIRLAGGGASGLSTGENDEGPVAWGQGFGGKVSREQNGSNAGYNGHFGGVLLGSDAAVSDNWRLGGLGSYTTTMVDSTGDYKGSSAHVKSYGAFAYANYEGKPWYMNLTAGNVWHHYNTKRDINFTGFSGNTTASFKGNQYLLAGLVGYPLNVGMMGTTLTPIAGVTYSNLHQDGYSEAGGNGAALTASGITTTSMKSDLAVKLDHRFKVSNGEVQPFMQLGWRHEYHTNALQSVANFSEDSSGATSFVAKGSKPIVDTGVLSAGVSVIGNRNLSLTVKYTGEAGRHYQSHTGNLQLRWQF